MNGLAISLTGCALIVYSLACLPFFFFEAFDMLDESFFCAQGKVPARKRSHHAIRNDRRRGIIDEKKNVAAGAQGVMLRVRMKGCYIDQLSARRVPDGVVYREEVSKAGIVGEILVLEHPAALPTAPILMHLTAHVLEASRLLSPGFGTEFRQTERLRADCRGELLDGLVQVII